MLDNPHQLQIGVEGLAPATQYAGVASLEAEAGDIDGDVGARLVDDADNPDGHPTTGEPQAILQHPAIHFGADRVIQHDHLAHIRHNPGQPGRIEQQAIQHGF